MATNLDEFLTDAQHIATDHESLPGVLSAAEHAATDHESLPGVLSLTEHTALDHAGLTGIRLGTVASSTTSAASTTTSTIPKDDTIPTSSEGVQVLSVTFTPQNASSTLLIFVTVMVHKIGSNDEVSIALFKSAESSARAVGADVNIGADEPSQVTLMAVEPAAAASSQTWTVRAGASIAGTVTINGFNGARLYGAAEKSSIIVIEILP